MRFRGTGRVRRLGAAWAAAALLVCAAGVAAGAAAPAESATEAIRKGNDRLRELLAREAPDEAARDRIMAQITRELRNLFDIDFLAQRALADHWGEMTPRQRSDVQKSLRSIIERNYLSQLRGNLDYRTDYLGEEPKGEDVLVKTVIRAERRGRPARISVDYRLRSEDGQWRVYDVITEEVSVLQNYRGQFNRIIAKDGVDGLIARMRARLEKGEKGEKSEKSEKSEKVGGADKPPKAGSTQ